MSRRTAESNKAILVAWIKEQELVQEGKGTREWTLQQQRDILDKGKAYDDDGIAFQGQHMKSAEKYPQYQGEPENIQFLTRTEHLDAHNGNWRNPTNWYFNPVTKEKNDFGEGLFIPCEIIQLTEPIIRLQIKQNESISTVQSSDRKKEQSTKQASKSELPKKVATPKNKTLFKNTDIGFGQKLKNGLKIIGNTIVEFPKKHPTATKVIGFVVATAAAAVVESSKNVSTREDDDNYDNAENSYDDRSVDEDGSVCSDNDYTPNDVPAGRQRYHYKDGSVKWKDKPSYHRGGNNDE